MERTEETTVAVVEAKPALIKLNPQAIAIIVENVALAEQLVTSVLERGVDYGRTPGTPQEGLWDAGASKIAAAFNSYPMHEVLYHEESDNVISYVIQCKLINRNSQEVVATGLGACSTREPKYRYRWVKDPENYGYTEAEIGELKFRESDDKYRIENPEYGELVNTLLQMAAKRSECDAAKSLPGVGSALRKLFDPELKSRLTTAPPGSYKPSNANPPTGEIDEDSPRWTSFWTQAKALLGTLAEQKGIDLTALVHQTLGVKSMKDWLKEGKGRSLDDAIRTLSTIVDKGDESKQKSTEVTSKIKPRSEWDKITPEDVPNYPRLETIFHTLTDKQPKEMYVELGVGNRNDMTIPVWDSFITLRERFAPTK